jgi:phosphatidylglycerol---prolipoprotein diacylglyceryl transferase
VSFRIGAWVFTAGSLLNPMAAAFFLVLAYQGLYPAVFSERRKAMLLVAATSATGLIAAWAFAVYSPVKGTESVALAHEWSGGSFSSFGGYWGALPGAGLVAMWLGKSPLRVMDRLVPAILVAGCVARIGCLFTGCCRGIWLDWANPPWLQPLWPFPAYDIVALLITLIVAVLVTRKTRERPRPGAVLCVFLVLYAVQRFGLEFLRPSLAVVGPLNVSHLMAITQVMIGIPLGRRVFSQVG